MKYDQMKKCTIMAGIFAGAYAFSLRPRKRYEGMERFIETSYAHRGLHGRTGFPENSIAAFVAAKEAGYGIELDVHLLQDGNVVVFHDHNLSRLCGDNRIIEEMTLEEIRQYKLLDTEEKIPLLSEVLAATCYEAPFLVEIKTYQNNGAELMRRTLSVFQQFPKLHFCVQSFDPRPIRWCKVNAPRVIRGILSTGCRGYQDGGANLVQAFAMSLLMTNFLASPDFIAYDIKHRRHCSIVACRKIWRPNLFYWTVRTSEEMAIANRHKATLIFENLEP